LDKPSIVPHSSASNGTPHNSIAVEGIGANGATEAITAFSDASLTAGYRGDGPTSSSGRYGVEESVKGFDFQQFLLVVRRRWPLMLGVFLAALGLGIGLNLIARPIYQSSAMIELNTATKGDIGAEIPGLGEFLPSKQSQSIATQTEILRGGPILSEARKSLAPPLQEQLKSYAPLTVEQVNTSNLLNVTARSHSPEAAAAFANAVCNQYIAVSLKKNRENSLGALRYLENQVKSVQKRLATKQNELKQFKQRTGIFSISEQASALSGGLTQAQNALQQVQAERVATAAQIKAMQDNLARIPADRVLPTGISRNPEVDALQNQLTQLEIQRSSALQEYTPASFKVRAIDADIKATRERLSKLARTIVSGYAPDPARQPLLQNIANTQSQLWATDARARALNGQLAKARSAFAKLPEQEFQFSQLSTDVTVLQQSYQLLIEKLQSLRIGAEGQVADARLVFAAKPNSSPVAPDKKRTLLYSILLGTIAAVALAMLVDALDNRIYNEADATRATSLSVLAHIPYIKNTAEQSLTNTGDRVTPLLESFRMLRANIAFSAVDRPIKAIVVSSSVPNEGKSNSALNLAIATALGGEKVVLIDLDLRRPTQHKLSGLSNSIGFTNVISGQSTLEEALQETSTPGLRILTSGPVPPNPFRLLNSQSARQVIREVIDGADFVVVDTPPMLGLADARLISSLVDGTLMIISCQETGRREAGRAAELLLQSGNEVLGAVLTKVPAGNDGYGYDTYKYYGRYFSEEDNSGDGLSTHEDETPALSDGKGKKKKV
jgi:capsular exopolysaccharide synthesis family protein